VLALLDFFNPDPLLHLRKPDPRQRLDQNVSELVIRADQLDFDPSFCSTLTHQVVPDFDVLALPMMNGVLDQING
jgi:hypothetical protein